MTRRAIAIAAALVLAVCAVGQTQRAVEQTRPLADRLDSLLQAPLFNKTTVGIMVYDITADSVLYDHNGQLTMRPASTMKILTTVAALDCLGADHNITTTLSYDGTNLYVKGDFDPLFSTSDLNAFVSSVRSLGVDTISGTIIADTSMKDTARLGEGWCWDDNNPTLSPLLLDRKDNFVEVFKRRLAQAGIVLRNSPIQTLQYIEPTVLATVTHTIADLLPQTLQQSDNLYAEAIFYHIAACSNQGRQGSKGQAGATSSDARQAINSLITRCGLAPADYCIADGSGLSLYNYLSPQLLVAILTYAHRNHNIRRPLTANLPLAGVSGTLAKRMRHNAAHRNVRAKTGSLFAVSSLAGYCTADNGHTIAFAIINQGQLKAAPAREFQDNVCHELCQP